MPRFVVAALLGLAAWIGLGSPAGAQEQEARVRPTFSISLAASEGAQLGVWARLHPHATVGFNVGATRETLRDDEGSERFGLLSLEPAAKLDLAAEGAFAPYLYGSLFAESGRTRAEATVGGATATAIRTRRRSGAAMGAGMDWYVVPRLSVGGHLGVLAGRASTSLRIEGAGGAPSDQRGSFFSTFSSGVRIHLYF